jgi:hypothetical protein
MHVRTLSDGDRTSQRIAACTAPLELGLRLAAWFREVVVMVRLLHWHMAANVLITGPPRAGTTLTTQLLGGLPDCVAQDEPMDIGLLVEDVEQVNRRTGSFWRSARSTPKRTVDRDRAADNVIRFCAQSRESVLRDGTVISKHVESGLIGSKVADEFDSNGKRTKLTRRGVIHIDKALSPEFTLFVKHPAAFTAILPELKARAPIFAIVRNPLAILASWNTVPFAVGKGHSALAERMNPDLEMELSRRADLFDRQIYLLDWFFDQFARHLGPSRTIRYEDIIASDGKALSVIHPAAADIQTSLNSRNQAKVYDMELMKDLGDRLLVADGSYWSFYHREDVLSLISA